MTVIHSYRPVDNENAVGSKCGTLAGMELRVTLAMPPKWPHREQDIEITAPIGTRLGVVRSRLAQLVGVEPSQPLFIGVSELNDDDSLGSAPLVHGAQLSLMPTAPIDRAATPYQLHAISGPDAGGIWPLTPGAHMIGRSPDVAIRLADADLSREHAQITLRDNTIYVIDDDSTNGTYCDNDRIKNETEVKPGQLIRCGASVLTVLPQGETAITTRSRDDGTIGVQRPPRLMPPEARLTLRYPAPPAAPMLAKLPWLTVLATLVLGVAVYASASAIGGLATSAVYLVLAAASPVFLLLNAVGDRVTAARAHRRALNEHTAATTALERQQQETINNEAHDRRAAAPDPATLAVIAGTPTIRLWERRPNHHDALLLRLGLGDLPAHLVVDRPQDDSHPPPLAPMVPITVSLREAGVFGIAGSARHAMTRTAIAQLTVLHSPQELRLEILTASAKDDWWWARWLPHLSTAPSGPHDGIPDAKTAVADRLTVLIELMKQRLRQRGTPTTQQPWAVLILDDPRQLGSREHICELLNRGPEVGIFAICLAATVPELPEQCRAVARVERTHGELLISGHDHLNIISPDLVNVPWASTIARALAPLSDETPESRGTTLPVTVELTELVTASSAQSIIERWQRFPAQTKVPLGMGVNGPVWIDVVTDGPHALIAGTTGSGKSELLQSLVLTLALHNRPDELSFVLIDYKGGATFAECAELPHTVGLLTDLDSRSCARALVSLQAEIRRREKLFADLCVADLDKYQRARQSQSSLAPMPRLVIVVDEFAVLSTELPTMLTGLIDIARRGRSLGIHLILATQRPLGTVSAEIRANIALRICLRVNDPNDSRDIVDVADAAYLPQGIPGRAIARLASGLVTFQVARPHVVPPDTADAAISIRPWPNNVSLNKTAVLDTSEDLRQVIQEITKAAAELEIAQSHSPWLPALSPQLELRQLDKSGPADHAGHKWLPLGLLDEPAAQRQSVYGFDLANDAHLLVIGAARSGRTTAARTLVASLSERVSPADARLYLLDCGGGGLVNVAGLPHCAAMATPEDPDFMLSVLTQLEDEIAGRRGSESTSLHLLFLDSWEGFTEALAEPHGGPATDVMCRLLRLGPTRGLRVVITGECPVLHSPIGRLMSERLILRLTDADAYLAAGVPATDVPSSLPAGRALRLAESTLELQIAAIDPASINGEVAGFDRYLQAARQRWPAASWPPRSFPLPTNVNLRELPVKKPPQTGILIGLGQDNKPTSLELAGHNQSTALIAGPPGSGRSTALVTIATQWLHEGGDVLAITPRPSPLRRLAAHSGMTLSTNGTEIDWAKLTSQRRPLILVDDVETIRDTEIEAVLCAALVQHQVSMIAAGTTDDLGTAFRGLVPEMRRSRTGILLNPGPRDGDLFNVSITPMRLRRPGRGLLIQHGASTPIQIAQSS